LLGNTQSFGDKAANKVRNLFLKPRRKQRVSVFVSFSLNDPDLVTIAEQIRNPQVTNLADAPTA